MVNVETQIPMLTFYVDHLLKQCASSVGFISMVWSMLLKRDRTK